MTNVATSRAERTFALVAIALFAALATLLASFHEPWHDELQAWRIAIDSRNLVDLAQNLRYEGHPMLFYLLLRAVGMLSRSWTAAVAFHLVIACATAFIVLRFAPFSRLQRVLVIGGYFFLYEYTVLVRSYGLGALFALGACAAWCAPRRRTHVAVLLILLLANTRAVGLVLALAMTIAFVFDAFLYNHERWWARPAVWAKPLSIGVAATAMAVIVVLQILPPRDSRYRGSGVTNEAATLWFVSHSFALPAHAFAPFADVWSNGTPRWGTWLFEPSTRSTELASDLVALSLVLAAAAICVRHQSALLLWLAGVSGLLLFFMFFHAGSIRHHGYFVLAFIAAAWLAHARPPSRWPPIFHGWITRFESLRPRVFSLLLAPMVLASAQLGIADIRWEFTDAPAISRLLQLPKFANLPIVGLAYAESQTVAALLDRPVYLVGEQRLSTFRKLGQGRLRAPDAELADSTVSHLLTKNCRVILIGSKQNPPSMWLRARAELLSARNAVEISNMRMYVWLVHAPASPICPAASQGP